MSRESNEYRSTLRVIAVATFLGLAGSAVARPQYLKIWSALYPDSQSATNVAAGMMGQACFLCHATCDGPPPGRLELSSFSASAPLHFSWNEYGWSMRRLILSGLTAEQAMGALEPADSDGAPGGATNLEEIESDTQPGWASGKANTTHHRDGGILERVPPPKDAAGDMDPPGTRFCTSRANSTGAPATMSSSGSSVVAENVFTLHAAPVPNGPGMFFYGEDRAEIPFGGGVLCVGAPLHRLGLAVGAENRLTTLVDLTALPPGGQIVVGSTWHFQAWFADLAGLRSAFNTSDGLAVTFR